MLRHPYLFAFLLWLPIAGISIMPFAGPVAVCLMLVLRWYWTTLSPRKHYAGLMRHLIFALIGPLALVGSISISSALPAILAARGDDWSMLSTLQPVWTNIGMPLASKVLGAYVGVHDWIHGLLDIQSKWLPSSWWQIAGATDPTVVYRLLDKSWGGLIVIGSWLYVTLSFLNHASVALALRAISAEEAQMAAHKAKVAAEEDAAAAKEIARIKAGGIPKMSNGKSSALEF